MFYVKGNIALPNSNDKLIFLDWCMNTIVWTHSVNTNEEGFFQSKNSILHKKKIFHCLAALTSYRLLDWRMNATFELAVSVQIRMEKCFSILQKQRI